MFSIREPNWGLNFVEFLKNFVNSHEILNSIVPIFAEIFILGLPILLVVIYCFGLYKKDKIIKESALWGFITAIFTTFTNIIIQFFFKKERPMDIGLGGENIVEGIDKILPNSSFPSDHAAMSMGFAIALLIRGIQKKNKIFIGLGIIFILFSVIMSVSRIIVGEHWPSDILGGFIVGIIVPIILSRKKIYNLLKKYVIANLIKFQEKIRYVFIKK